MIIHIDSSVVDIKSFYGIFAEFNAGFCGHSLDAVHDVLTEQSDEFEVFLGTESLRRLFGNRSSTVIRMFTDSAEENPFMKLTLTDD